MTPLPHHLNTFADALALVPAPARAAEAKAIIAECVEWAARHNALNAGRHVSTWGDFLQPACLNRLNASTAPREWARIDTRDGLQAFEVAIYALTDMVRDAERVAA